MTVVESPLLLVIARLLSVDKTAQYSNENVGLGRIEGRSPPYRLAGYEQRE